MILSVPRLKQSTTEEGVDILREGVFTEVGNLEKTNLKVLYVWKRQPIC